MSDRLESEGLARKGSGISIGADIYRLMPIFQFMAILVGIEGAYDIYTYVTDSANDASVEGYPVVDKVNIVRYGAIAGFSLFTDDGVSFAVNIKALLEDHMNLVISPMISITADRR